MKRITCILLILTGASVFALEITGTPPEITGNNAINTEIAKIFNDVLYEFQDLVKDIDTEPQDLIRAFGNSGVYASHGATQRAFGGYRLFSASVGAMMGFQLPASPFKLVEELENIADKITEEGDISLGLSPHILNAQLGINMSFLVENLYLGLRVGYFKIDPENFNFSFGEDENGDEGNFGDLKFSFKTNVFGITANYQLLAPRSLFGVLTWRGLNLGTGFIYQNTNLSLSMNMGDVIEEYSTITGVGTIGLGIEPRINFGLNFNTFTIPLEAITAFNILFVNIPIGLGADLAFGKSKLEIGADAKINLKGLPSGVTLSKEGEISITGGGEMSPSFFNLKLMTGIGFKLGPVVIDIPLTYYFFNNGFNIGLTLGVTF